MPEYTAKPSGKPRMEHLPRLQKWLMRNGVSISVLALAFPASLGCATHLPSPASHRPPRMNVAMLAADRPERLVVQVDWVDGAAPEDHALRALERFLRRTSSRPPGLVEVRRGHEVSRAPGRGLDGFRETVLLNAVPEPGTYFIYVLYGQRLERYRGLAMPAGELDREIGFPVVMMFLKPIRRDSALWISRRKVESAVLVHEIGHVAGLVTSGREGGRAGRPGHCPDPACRMYWGVDRASLRANAFSALCLGRLPLRFCDACEAELAFGRAEACKLEDATP